jgi:hypothetical protein
VLPFLYLSVGTWLGRRLLSLGGSVLLETHPGTGQVTCRATLSASNLLACPVTFPAVTLPATRQSFLVCRLPCSQIVASIQSFRPCSWEVVCDALRRWNQYRPTCSSQSQSRILGLRSKCIATDRSSILLRREAHV